jgi:hypothetical protein
VPLARAAVDLESTPEAREAVQAAKVSGSSVRDSAREEIASEILEAIRLKLDERH